jgi:large subunit ribosomal protein L7/L12
MTETSRLKKLTERRNAVNARIRKEQNKLAADKRRADTRRKILMGAWAFEKSGRDSEFAKTALAELKEFLVRDSDRALFGIPPASAAKK